MTAWGGIPVTAGMLLLADREALVLRQRGTTGVRGLVHGIGTLALAAAAGCATGTAPTAGDEKLEVVQGTLRGVRCATTDELCADSPSDPSLRLESDLVLVQADGDIYYLFGIDRETKLHFALATVRVVGDVNPKYRTIDARRMEAMRDGDWEVVWKPGRPYQPRRQPGATRP